MSTALVITTINDSDNEVLKKFSSLCNENGIDLIIVGDIKTPSNFLLPFGNFLSLAAQKTSAFQLAHLLPDNHYSKKNIGYLHAMLAGSETIIETDDDNLPYPAFWEPKSILVTGRFEEQTSWLNIYREFTNAHIWPRGFSLQHLGLSRKTAEEDNRFFECPVQQGLANLNPDVDAIYRLTRALPLNFEQESPVILGTGSICPFNSQNTVWFKKAYPLMYLPSYCSFRMTDIWRSFIAQRIFWTCDWHLAFFSPTVYQERNHHDLLKDFELEIPGYLHNANIMKGLIELPLQRGEKFIFENLKSCYQFMIEENYIDQEEIPLLNTWISDFKRIFESTNY